MVFPGLFESIVICFVIVKNSKCGFAHYFIVFDIFKEYGQFSIFSIVT